MKIPGTDLSSNKIYRPEGGGVEPHTPRSVPFAYQTKIHPVDFTLPATSGKTIIS